MCRNNAQNTFYIPRNDKPVFAERYQIQKIFVQPAVLFAQAKFNSMQNVRGEKSVPSRFSHGAGSLGGAVVVDVGGSLVDYAVNCALSLSPAKSDAAGEPLVKQGFARTNQVVVQVEQAPVTVSIHSYVRVSTLEFLFQV